MIKSICVALVIVLPGAVSTALGQGRKATAKPAAAATPAPAAPSVAAAPTAVQMPGLVITLKDGRAISVLSVRREGNNVMATVPPPAAPGSTPPPGAAAATVGYQVNTIAKMEFPEPAQLRAATELLAQGKAPAALAQIDPIVSYYEPFKDVPGNWWSQAAMLKLNALLALQRDREAETLIGQLTQASNDPEAARAGRVQMAANWVRKGDTEKALPVFETVIKESKDEDTLAQAWLNKGHCLLADKKFEEAALAYLHVPVFYADQKLLMPAALLGSARAFVGLEDLQNARNELNDLIREYPASSEAATAKTELQKLDRTSS